MLAVCEWEHDRKPEHSARSWSGAAGPSISTRANTVLHPSSSGTASRTPRSHLKALTTERVYKPSLTEVKAEDRAFIYLRKTLAAPAFRLLSKRKRFHTKELDPARGFASIDAHVLIASKAQAQRRKDRQARAPVSRAPRVCHRPDALAKDEAGCVARSQRIHHRSSPAISAVTAAHRSSCANPGFADAAFVIARQTQGAPEVSPLVLNLQLSHVNAQCCRGNA